MWTGSSDGYEQQIFDVVDATVREYIAEGRGEPLAPLPPGMPFMEAGLDSLDMLKVSLICLILLSCLFHSCGLSKSKTVLLDGPAPHVLASVQSYASETLLLAHASMIFAVLLARICNFDD